MLCNLPVVGCKGLLFFLTLISSYLLSAEENIADTKNAITSLCSCLQHPNLSSVSQLTFHLCSHDLVSFCLPPHCFPEWLLFFKVFDLAANVLSRLHQPEYARTWCPSNQQDPDLP